MKRFQFILIVLVILFVVTGCKGGNQLDYAKNFKLQNIDAVENDLDLPKKYVDGDVSFTITWESSNTEIIKIEDYPNTNAKSSEFFKGVVIRPEFKEGNKEVTLTATFVLDENKKVALDYKVNVISLPEEAVSAKVIINQIYGGGGNKDATYKNDYVELYNPTNKDIDLTGWTLQYASKAGDFKLEADYPVIVELSGVIKAGKYYLIQLGAGAGGTKNLPTPDALGGINASATEGKFVLTNKKEAVKSLTDAHVMDYVGYGPGANIYEGSGPAISPSNTLAIIRKDFADTNDNKADFKTATPTPRNSKN